MRKLLQCHRNILLRSQNINLIQRKRNTRRQLANLFNLLISTCPHHRVSYQLSLPHHLLIRRLQSPLTGLNPLITFLNILPQDPRILPLIAVLLAIGRLEVLLPETSVMLIPTGALLEFCILEEVVRAVAYQEGAADTRVREGGEVVGVVAACCASGEARCVGAH